MENDQSQRPSDLSCCDKSVTDGNINPVQSALSPICSRRRFIKGVASSNSAALIGKRFPCIMENQTAYLLDNIEFPKTFQNGDHPVLFLFEQDKVF